MGVWQDVNSNVTQQDLLDSYMAPFQDCVEQGKVSGLMCSYNAVNGVPSCANDWLLKDVARGEWGFDGCVSTACVSYQAAVVALVALAAPVFDESFIFILFFVLVLFFVYTCLNTSFQILFLLCMRQVRDRGLRCRR